MTKKTEEIKNLLRNVPQFKDVPEKQIDWLIQKSSIIEIEPGMTLFKAGDAIDNMFVLLKGRISLKIQQNGQFREVSEIPQGGISGWLPYSRATTAQGYGFAVTKTKVLKLPKTCLREMVEKNYEMVEALVHTMSTRVREFTTAALQDEKMIALGKISAGLAHELNNPSAAIVRSSSELKKHLTTVPEKFKRVISIRLDIDKVDEVNNILFSKLKTKKTNHLSVIEKNDLEDEIAEFLENNSIEDGYSAAEMFVEFSITFEEIKKIHKTVREEDFVPVIGWIESVITTEKLVKEIEEASKRINDLVTSVKSYTHMDRAQDKQPAHIHEGIRNTKTILNHKLKSKNINYIETFEKNLPAVKMFINEMNQVWTNLMDNAIDAMDKNGTLEIKTEKDGKKVIVRVIDSGKGIPEKIKAQIFDPFFTTKPIGEGTGLGLDIVLKIVKKHNGTIKVDSVPGKTIFIVSLPLE